MYKPLAFIKKDGKKGNHWKLEKGKVIAYKNCLIIKSMIEKELNFIKTSKDGWTKTYKGNSKEIWELIYLESNLHDDGPPRLIQIK